MLSSLRLINSDSVDRIGMMNIVRASNKMPTQTDLANLLKMEDIKIKPINGFIENDHQNVTYYLLEKYNNNNNDCEVIDKWNKKRKHAVDGEDSNGSGSIDVVGCDLHQNRNSLSGDEKAPDHHARRPMNAFLIFCKRHRGIVKEKYPNLENR